MKTVFVRNIRAVIDNIPLLQKKLGVGLEVSSNQVSITGKEENIYDCEKVFDALEAGFDVNTSLLLADPEYLLEEMHIRDYSRRTNITDVRARLIGTKGKTKQLMEKLSDSSIKIKGNTIYIVGLAEDIRATRTAVEKLIRGSAQGKVYGFLERSRTQHKYDNNVKVNTKPKAKKLKVSSFSDDDNESDFPDGDFDEDIADGNKKVKQSSIKKNVRASLLKDDDLSKGIKNLQEPEDEGLEYED